MPEPSPEKIALLKLMRVEGVGPVRLRRLLDVFGSAESVLRASLRELRDVPTVGDKVAEAITRQDVSDEEIASLWERNTRLGVEMIFETDAEYPPSLREIHDNPAVIHARGRFEPQDRWAVAIVGSRRSTSYGREQAERFAFGLASRGVTVVSGLARGIDAAAHRGALKAGGRTIAVLASGLANIYPPEHLDLADEVASAGVVLTEAPLDGPPLAELFPLRNRIISGLSLAVLVIEAAERSGALSTARHAIEQNRDVFAIPGRIGDPASKGTNKLLQQGAGLALSPEDILEQLGPIEGFTPAQEDQQPELLSAPVPELGTTELGVWNAIGSESLPLESIAEKSGLTPAQASATLLILEIKKLIERLPGNIYQRRR